MKKLIFSSLFLVLLIQGIAQSTSDSLQANIKEAVQKEVSAELAWLKWVLGISVGSLSMLGIYLWAWKIKQTSEKVIKEKADSIIENALAAKIGVKVEVIREYFQSLEQDRLLKQKRILIINKNDGKRLSLLKILEKAGFTTTPVFMKMKEVEAGINPNNFDLMLIDNEDGSFNDEEIRKLVETYCNSLKFACFTKIDVSHETYRAISSYVKFAKDPNYLGQAIENSLK